MSEHSERRLVLAVATLASFLTPFTSAAVNVALPAIAQEFSADAVLVGWVATAFILAGALLLVPFGRLADIHGRKRVFALGVAVYTAGSVLCGLSGSAMQLIAFRAVQGTGGAMMFVTSAAMVTSAFPPGERGRALGVNIAGVYVGLSIGPFLGGIITQQLGWRGILFFSAPLGALVLVLTSRLRGEWAEAKGERFDLAGAAVYSLSLMMVMYGFTILSSLLGMALLCAGAGVGIAFLIWESRASAPMFNVSLFRKNATFAFSNVAALINYSATAAVTFFLSLYLQYSRGMSPQEAGLVLVSQPILMTVFVVVAGRVSDRVEPRAIASIGMAVTAASLALLALMPPDADVFYIVALLALLGTGLGIFSSPNMSAIMGSVEPRERGFASGALATMRTMGQLLSMGVAMLLFSVYIGSAQLSSAYSAQLAESMRVAFALFAVLSAIGIFASLARGKVNARAR